MSRTRWSSQVALVASVSGLLTIGAGAGWLRDAFAGSESSLTDSHVSQGKGGAQLWAQNCARCHDMRSSSMYSNQQWDVIVHQMRVRANLTAKEYEAIRKYLTSGN